MSYGYNIACLSSRISRVARYMGVIVGLLVIIFSFSACGDEKKAQAIPQVGEMSKHTFPNVHKFGKHRVSYTANISKETVVRLGEYLLANGWDESEAWGGKLAKRGEIYEMHVMMDEKLINDRKVQLDTQKMARLMSKRVFKGAEVEMHLCGERFILVKLITSG